MLTSDRRALLKGLAALALVPGGAIAAPALPGLSFGPAQPFSWDRLRQMAKTLAAQPFQPVPAAPARLLQAINYDVAARIHFRPEEALWRGGSQADPVSFFHLNKFNDTPVALYAVSGNAARPILYQSRYFDYSGTGINPGLLNDLGFGGFRVNDGQNNQSDWLAFQGASYFRSVGQDDQYGASARGIALNTALSTKEEFPHFTRFWLDGHGPQVTIYALLEGPSVTGVYKFDATHAGAVVMNVHCELFFRADITRLGIAPLTSMYWYGENQRNKATDWRPEIHDDDGLSIWNGRGERLWRPLVNPPAMQVNSFVDVNPRGFGLMQRDRSFDDYQDDSAFYNKRPGIWVEPHGNWGAGAVQLVEIPTDDEIHDNIVVYWRPDAPVNGGDSLSFDYKLYWQDSEPNYPAALARAVSTRIGRGGAPGSDIGNDAPQKKFVIDFQGGTLAGMPVRFDIQPDVTLSTGHVVNPYVTKLVGTDRWRALFDVAWDGKSPINMRCTLKLAGKPLSETWLYQYFP